MTTPDKQTELNDRLDAIALTLAEIRSDHEAIKLKAGEQRPGDSMTSARWLRGISLTVRTDAGNGSASQA